MKILHLTVMRELNPGQRKQLKFEFESAMRGVGSGDSWDVRAFHNGEILERFEDKIPWLFSPMFLRNLFCWLWLLKNGKKYDIVLLRYMTFDPFLILFGWIIKRYSVHHSKEVPELRLIRKGWKGSVAAAFEAWVGRVNSRQVLGLIGVTNEIGRYHQSIAFSRDLDVMLYPNGMDFSCVSVLQDYRSEVEVNCAFVCGEFSSWHGLDRLMAGLSDVSCKVKIHLIGLLSSDQLDDVRRLHFDNVEIVCHGSLSGDGYLRVLALCDVGIGSFALDRKGMIEAATLKVREYLAMGLPVYSGHIDVSIPKDFEFYSVGSPNLKDIINFAHSNKGIDRDVIRREAYPYLDKGNIMRSFVKSLKFLREK